MTNAVTEVATRRHPSERFILYLLTQGHPGKCSNEYVLSALTRHGLPLASNDYLDGLREELLRDLPKPFLPKDPRAAKTSAFLKRHLIYALHHPNREVAEANAILTDFVIRRPVEMGLLGRVPHKKIAVQIRSKHQVQLTADGVRAYEHYFWDVRTMSLEEWADTISGTSMPYLVKDQQLAALTCGGRVALHRMGLKTSIESTSMLKDMQRRLYLNFVEVDERIPISRDKAAMMIGLSNAALSIHKQVATSEQELRNLLKEFERLRLDTDQDKVTPMASVVDTSSGGTYSDTSDVLEGDGEYHRDE